MVSDYLPSSLVVFSYNQGMWNRNPDIDLRKLERNYNESGSLFDAIALMNSYLRAGDFVAARRIFDIAEPLYVNYRHAFVIQDLGVEASLVTAFL